MGMEYLNRITQKTWKHVLKCSTKNVTADSRQSKPLEIILDAQNDLYMIVDQKLARLEKRMETET